MRFPPVGSFYVHPHLSSKGRLGQAGPFPGCPQAGVRLPLSVPGRPVALVTIPPLPSIGRDHLKGHAAALAGLGHPPPLGLAIARPGAIAPALGIVARHIKHPAAGRAGLGDPLGFRPGPGLGLPAPAWVAEVHSPAPPLRGGQPFSLPPAALAGFHRSPILCRAAAGPGHKVDGWSPTTARTSAGRLPASSIHTNGVPYPGGR